MILGIVGGTLLPLPEQNTLITEHTNSSSASSGTTPTCCGQREKNAERSGRKSLSAGMELAIPAADKALPTTKAQAYAC